MARQSFWKREFTGMKLLFNIIFWGGQVAIFAVGWYAQVANEKLAGLNKLTFSVWLSRSAGLLLTIHTTLLLLPMCRNLLRWVRPKVKFLPLDESQWFHRQVAYAMLIATCIHVLAHYVNFFNVEKTQIRPEAAVQIHYTQAGGVTGHIMLLCMLLMYTSAHAKIRQQSFETFWYTHHLFIPFFLALYTHATGCFVRDSAQPYSPFDSTNFWTHCIGYEGWRWELVAGGIYLLERIYREIRARRPTQVVRVIRHPYDALELQFEKPGMKYKAGQWLFINIPSVSSQQWHPFTITSCPFDPYVSIHMRQVGDWTRAASDALGAGPAQQADFEGLDPLGMYEVALAAGQTMPAIRIDGPYGAPAEDVFNNEIAVLIGTGIGVTPWASILKNIWHLRAAPNPPTRLRRVEFIWVCKDTTTFEWFQALLASLEAQSVADAAANPEGEFLRIHTYLTQRINADTAANIYLNTVGAEVDPLTELRSRTNFGRPDFGRLFETMRDKIEEGEYMPGLGGSGKGVDVGVYFCGPNAAAKDIKSACGRASGGGRGGEKAKRGGVRFRFWKEHF